MLILRLASTEAVRVQAGGSQLIGGTGTGVQGGRSRKVVFELTQQPTTVATRVVWRGLLLLGRGTRHVLMFIKRQTI